MTLARASQFTPVRYEAARSALAECERVDECASWKAKAAALAEYARQSKDETLQKTADRIRLRAIRRAGELLKELSPKAGKDYAVGGRSPPQHSKRKAAADSAGLSADERKTALRIANVPQDRFDALVESRRPPTVTEMADLGKAHVSHNSGEIEWYTPPEYIEAARIVLGGIDLDPASCKAAQKNVEATRFYTKDDDGLSQTWAGRVWLNPPYGATGPFVEKLCAHLEDGSVGAAILLVNNATETDWFQRAGRYAAAMCTPRGRISFLSPSGASKSPLQGQVFLYFGDDSEAFVEVFSTLGVCWTGRP